MEDAEALESVLRQAVVFRRAILSESDRGCALMAAAHLSDQLERLLRAAFVDDESVAAPLFSGPSAFGSFSSRIDICYLFGLLPSPARRDLHLIRRIRNDFGHVAAPLTFGDASVAARCRELYSCADEPGAPPRDRFVGTALVLYGIIDQQVMQCERSSVPAEVVVDDGFRARVAQMADAAVEASPPGTEPLEHLCAMAREMVGSSEAEPSE
jgi:DNA-binding MltR family transcriptional regulator